METLELDPPPFEVVIINDFANFNGGASAVALNSAKFLAQAGCRVTLFATSGPVDPVLRTMPNLEVVCLEQTDIAHDANRFQAFINGVHNRATIKAMREVLRTKDPTRTIIHAHQWMKGMSPAVLDEVMNLGFKLVATLHDFFIVCPNGGFFEYPAKKLCFRTPLSMSCLTCQCDRRNYAHKLWRYARTAWQNTALRIPERVSHYIGVSNFSVDVMRPYLPDDVPLTVVPYPSEHEDHGSVDVSANDIFLFVGRLVPEKGPLLLAEAARRLGVRAVFAGDGEMREKLTALYPEFEITGWLDADGITAWLRKARALVFPSRWYETLGLVVVEAAACGVPAIVASRCAASEYVVHGSAGLHFNHADVDSLTARMRELRDDPALAARLGKGAYDWYWRNPWTASMHIEQLLRIYGQLLREEQPAAVSLHE